MDKIQIAEVALATVGMTEVIKNLIQAGGKRLWTLITLLVGAGMVAVAVFLPETVLSGTVAVSGAVVFYDTVFKLFQKLFELLVARFFPAAVSSETTECAGFVADERAGTDEETVTEDGGV